MPTLRITDLYTTTKANLEVSEYKIKQEGFNVLPEAEVKVDRTAYNGSGIDPGQDRAYIEIAGNDVFGGVLRAPERQGSKVKLQVRGFGQYLADAPPVPTGDQKIAADDATLIEECVASTNLLEEGIIDVVESGQTWVFGGVSQWTKAKKVANAAGGELKITPDRKVHYQAQRGRDKTGTTLSPGNASFVEDTFVVKQDGVTGNSTHLHVTGVGQGTHQVEVALVPQDDRDSYDQYDRVATYDNPDWGDGDPERWTGRSNKELKNEKAAEAWARNLMAELNDAEIRLETTVKSDYVELGDRFHVYHPREGIDENLRAVEVTEVFTPDGGRRWQTVFSNFSVAHSDQVREDHKNAERYGGSAYEGDLTNIQQGPGRGPVDSSHDYVLSVYYPQDVVAEVRAQMNISGLNYRAYSQGAADNADFTQTAFDNVAQGTTTLTSGAWNTLDSYSPTADTSELRVYVQFAPDSGSYGTFAPDIRLYNQTKSTYHPDSTGHPVSSEHSSSGGVYDTGTFEVYDPTNTNGDTVNLQFYNNDSGDATIDYRTLWVGIGQHTHSADPGLIDFDGSGSTAAHYPENVDVVVNGTSLGHSFGDGTQEFNETVDVGGEMSPGWNEIRLTSGALGHLDATFSADLFRQSL